MRTSRKQTLQQALLDVGVSRYGLLKSETRQLPGLLRSDEVIHGCVYGRCEAGSAMLIATDQRLIYLDKKPLHTIVEETTYDQIMDVGADWQAFYSKVSVHARARRFVLKYVRTEAARIFIRYLESAVMGLALSQTQSQIKNHYSSNRHFLADEKSFMLQHGVCTVSTIGDGGYPYGATLLYFMDPITADIVRFVTRSQTQTALNIKKSPKIALTISDQKTLSTMHITGKAELETNMVDGRKILQALQLPSEHIPKGALPPVAQIVSGAYEVYRLNIETTRYVRYNT